MDDPSFFEKDLDEEKAKRSILVTDVPENVSPKDVVIHFQREGNGGGEVVNIDDHGNEHRSSVVITFELPSIVENAIKIEQIIKGKKVTVQRYPVETKIPEVFSDVDARINLNVFDGSVSLLQQVLRSLTSDLRIECYENDYGYTIRGSYEQITLCHKYILREICRSKATENDMAPETASPDERGASSKNTGSRDYENIDVVHFQSVPIILDFILTVEKYAKRIDDIETKFNVKIDAVEKGSGVAIRPLLRCRPSKHNDACEEYIKLYREICDTKSIVCKDILLKPGEDSNYSVKEAVDKVLRKEPVAIQKMEEQHTWLFYGENTSVRSAISKVCKMLKMDNPIRKGHKANVKYVEDEEKDDFGAAHSHPLLSEKDEAEKDSLQANYKIQAVKIPIYKDFPNDKDQPFAIETKKGFRLTVYQGDITREHVDVIVNTTDEHLSFAYGLPAAIVRNGGVEIQDEARHERMTKSPRPGGYVKTGPGRLPCSSIIHILTKKYKSTKRDQSEEYKKLVKEACLNCLKVAHGEKCKSIAFPAVGSGQQEMPLDVCASTMVSGVEEYMKRKGSNKDAITDIRFVHTDPAAVEAFKVELSRRYKGSIVPPPGRAGITKRTKHSTLTLPSKENAGSPPGKKTEEKDEEDVCPICLDGFHDPVTLSNCNHKFCMKCIDQAFQHRKVCPTCGMTYGVQTGNMPYGTMNHYFDHYRHLPGYERYGTITIDYHFPDGTQGPEHPNPGQRYSGTARMAYLPDCQEGREVLGLLIKAFNARLTFTIGRSVTTGASNVVTWNDIHHKTNPYGGATGFGYPDPTYLQRVKAELAAKGIS